MKQFKTAGIIAEYNPFHKGHEHQINMLKKQGFTHIVAIISPSVVQRGECAFFETSVRVKAALSAGASLVLSLPAPFALLSAQGFAEAAVNTLVNANICDYLAFGAETPNVKLFIKTAEIVNTNDYNLKLKQYLKTGVSYANARQSALFDIDKSCGELLSRPNNILGVEYCTALFQTKKNIPKPLALKREGANHDETLNESAQIASASAIRQLLKGLDNYSDAMLEKTRQYVPKSCFEIYKIALQSGRYINEAKWEIALLSRLRAIDEQNASKIYANTEGFDKLLLKAVKNAKTLNDVYDQMKSKRYAHSRIRRFVLNAALGNTNDIPKKPAYIHALGMAKDGEILMAHIAKNSTLPFSTSLSKLAKESKAAKKIANAHSNAEDLTALCLNSTQGCKNAFTQKFIVL